jgi:hypothetical protein
MPSGPLELFNVQDLARLIWRRENLSVFQAVKVAREPFVSKESDFPNSSQRVPDLEELRAAESAEIVKSQESQARKELGDMYELVAAGEIATVPFLEQELELMERLNDMIDSCIKRLLRAKGLKSISVSASMPPQRLPALAKAA